MVSLDDFPAQEESLPVTPLRFVPPVVVADHGNNGNSTDGFFQDGEVTQVDPDTVVTPKEPSPASWRQRLLERFSSKSQTAPVVQRALENGGIILPQEKNLAELIECEKNALKFYAIILANRERFFQLQQESGQPLDFLDPRLSPELTELWRERIIQKKEEIAILEAQLAGLRHRRILRNSTPPVPLAKP